MHRSLSLTMPVLLLALTACAVNDEARYSRIPSASTVALSDPRLQSGAAGTVSSSSTTIGTAASPLLSTRLSADAVDFIFQAGASGAAEMQAAQLALQQSSSPVIRDLASLMLRDHGIANQSLIAIGQAKGVTVPTLPDQARQNAAAILASLSGPEFDRQFVAQQLGEHEVAAVLFRHAAQWAEDPDLRNVAAQTVPVIEMHRDHLAAIAAQQPRLSLR